MIDNFIGRERLAQKPRDSGIHETIEPVTANETGAKNHCNIAPDFAEPMKRFLAVHERHRQIEQDELEGLRLPAEKIESFKAGLRGHYLVTRFAQEAL